MKPPHLNTRTHARMLSATMLWALCLLCAAGGLAAPAKKPGQSGAAPQEEVNVLMFGVIQFSESLNYAFESTAARMEKIGRALSGKEDALRRATEQTEQAAAVEKQIKEVIQLLQAQLAEQQAQTKEAEERLSHVEKEEAELRTQVARLESHLDSFPTAVSELQKRAAENSDILRGLQDLTQFQKSSIESHEEQLSTLQRLSEET